VILNQPGMFAWQVFDAKIIPALRDEYRIKRVTKVRANTLEELCKMMDGVNAEAALREIQEYNKAVKHDKEFNMAIKDGRRTEGLAINKTNWANTVDTAPFEAYAVTCGVTFSFGGLKISTDPATEGQVEDTSGQPIHGLYAAGELVGGIFYHNYPGGTGLTSGSVFGRLSGTTAGKAVKVG
jgi:tricarballylate dehydrogenase